MKKAKNEFVWPVIESVQQEHEDAVEEDSTEVGVDFVVVFIGKNMRSGDVSRDAGGTRIGDLQGVLQRVVSSANSSWSLPYVAPSKDGLSFADVLVRDFAVDVEDSESRLGKVAMAGSCGIGSRAESIKLDALQDYLPKRLKTKAAKTTELVVVCSDSEIKSEGEVLDELLGVLDEMKSRYVALYTTDLSAEEVLGSRPRGRQLGSVVYEGEEYCNEVCQAKATILEGLLVGLTLLIILISGLCCMSGIASPVRFETSKDGQ